MEEKPGPEEVFSIPFKFKDPLRQKLLSILKEPLENFISLKKCAAVYEEALEKSKREDVIDFVSNVLKVLKVDYGLSENDLKNIPKSGPCLVIANHPFGGMEGLMFADILMKVRPDVKVMANYMLGKIPELKNTFIKVDPYGTKQSLYNNIKPMKETINWLKEGHVVALFPAGDVSLFQLRNGRVYDPPWNEQIARIIRKTQTTVLPMYFGGSNSILFYILGKIHRTLKTARLPHEIVNKGNKKVEVKISSAIPFKTLERFESDNELIKYLRNRVYLLKNRTYKYIDRRKLERQEKRIMQLISLPQNIEDLRTEIESLLFRNKLLEQKELTVFYGTMDRIPNLVHEIGRLREITFRKVGEGTGKEIDLDHFDTYYTHLFIWNKEKEEIVGAYRLGLTDKILELFGIKGLYTSTLFKFKPKLFEYLEPGIEMGRSFVREEYQRDFAPLMLLWKGIGHFMLKNPYYRVLYGPVSINDEYTSISRTIITMFLKRKHFNTELAKFVKPRTPLRTPILKRGFYPKALSSIIENIDEASKLVSEVEVDNKGVPILLKQYLKLSGEILGFNLDAEFSDVLDALIMVDLAKTSPRILERYMGKEGTKFFLAYNTGGMDKAM